MASPKARSAPAVFTIVALLLLFFIIAWTAWSHKSPTFDEPLHLVASYVQTHLGDFRCDPEDPPLWRYYLAAATNPNNLSLPTSGFVWDSMLTDRAMEGPYFKQVFYATPDINPDAVLAAARLRMLLLGVALGATIAAWAWKFGGPIAGIVAAAAFSLDPNFLAHAPLVKNDVASALVLLLFAIAVWCVGNRATPLRCLALALALTATLTVKFSGLIAVPLLAFALLIRARIPAPWPVAKWNLRSRSRKFVAAVALTLGSCAIAYIGIWACYAFRYGPSADPAQIFDFRELLVIARSHEYFAAYNTFFADPAQQRAFNAHWQPGVTLRLGQWANAHHLLPQTWLEGFLFTTGTAPGRAAFLLGTSSMVGRWYYFPIAMLVKTPVATILATIAAAIYWLLRKPPANRWNAWAFSLVPVAYLLVAIFSNLNLGIRHILPVYPFDFIAIGLAAADAVKRFRKPAIIAISLFLIALATETFAAYPNFIPFFNIAAGGWRNGPDLLGDSNLDWGQDLPALAAWQRDHPQYQLLLSYFGSADPRYYHIHYIKLPGGYGPEDQTTRDSRPPIYALSANAFQNPFLAADVRAFYDRLRTQQPIAVLGHCIYLYNPPTQ